MISTPKQQMKSSCSTTTRLFYYYYYYYYYTLVGYIMIHAAETTITKQQQRTLDSSCTLFLAESTIPNAGLGVYTSIERHPDEIIGEPDLCIPLVDMNYYNNNDQEHWFWPLDDYVWSGHVMGMSSESLFDDDIEAFCVGLDAVVNCNLALLNVAKSNVQYYHDHDIATTRRRRRQYDDTKNPGVGSYSPYQINGTTRTTHSIPAGGELFKYYGESWFTSRPHSFGSIPLLQDYETVERLLRKLEEKLQRVPYSIRQALYEDVILQQLPWKDTATNKRFYNALPLKYSDVQQSTTDGSSSNGDGSIIRSLHQDDAVRSHEWLLRNGRCLDHLQARPSLLPNGAAARGAFAKRSLPRDTIITTSPLLHIVDRQYLNMHHHDNDNQQQQQQQLLLNYVFGHAQSSLLLCPYGSSIMYINHNQTLQNVKLQWTQDGVMHHNDTFFNLTPSEMKWNYQPSLAIDLIATRDIHIDEELYLDYGDAFERAWQEHVSRNSRDRDHHEYEYFDDYYAPAAIWNNQAMFDDSVPLRTRREQFLDPYPPHILLKCHSLLLLEEEHTTTWRHVFSNNDEQTVARLWLWNEHTGSNERGVDCDIEARRHVVVVDGSSGEWVYDVTVYDDDRRSKDVVARRQENVPRSAFQFFDVPGTTDIHLPHAFRHEIHLPDEMVPEKWRNLKREEGE